MPAWLKTLLKYLFGLAVLAWVVHSNWESKPDAPGTGLRDALAGPIHLTPLFLAERWTNWAAALSGGEIEGLDTLWSRLSEEAKRPSARAILELRLAGIAGASLPPTATVELQRLLARALDLPPEELPATGVLEPLLEGYLLALLGGVPDEEVREAYFRYWLSYVK